MLKQVSALLGVLLVVGATWSHAQEAAVTNFVAQIGAALRASDFGEADSLLRTARSKGVPEAVVVRSSASVLMARRKFEKARSLLSRYLKASPDDALVRSLLCTALVELGDSIALEEHVKKLAIQSRQTRHLALLGRGQLLMAKGEFKQARDAFSKAAQLWPANRVKVLRFILQCDLRLGDTFSQRDHAETLLSLVPNHSLANYVLGSLALKQGEYEQGVSLLEKSVAAGGGLAAKNDLAWAFFQLGRLQEAREMTEHVLEASPGLPAALDTLGMVMLKRGQVEQAEALFAKALRNGHQDLAIFVHLAMARSRKGDKAGAREIIEPMLKKELDLSPEDRKLFDKLVADSGISVPAGE